VDEDGRIYFDEIALRLEDGREVAIVPRMRGTWPHGSSWWLTPGAAGGTCRSQRTTPKSWKS